MLVPFCSVIIPSYNGESRIGVTLEALAEQSHQDFEVIVVVDGSSDQTYEKLRQVQILGDRLRVINSPKNRGRARSRNLGSFFARGSLLIFLDDDLVSEPNWLSDHLDFHKRSSEAILVGSQKDTADIQGNDFLEFKNWLHQRWTKPTLARLSSGTSNYIKLDAPYITASNFSISRSLFMSMGRFNSALTDLEDFELACRAFELGIPIFLNPTPAVFNVDRVNHTAKTYVIRLRAYNAARERLYSLGLVNRPRNKEVPLLSKIKCLIFWVFRNEFWIKFIDLGIFAWLPRVWRFKLYDVILTANSSAFPCIFLRPRHSKDF